MAGTKCRSLTGELETVIMKEVWARGQASVREVYESLREQRTLAYTTVMSTMQNLTKKGLLDHRTVGRTYVYSPRVERRTVERSSARELINRLFEGSVERFANALFEDEELSAESFEALRRKILDMRKERPDA